MERFPKPEVGCSAQQHSDQFEAYVYRKPRSTAYVKTCHCELLPPPPYLREPEYWEDSHCLEISS
ncbi:hypothetical protein E2562_024623 [Oryza meyeriana var. granulata]|uniref:Uncharacterized protein n=1 Tax=Oryza meyeriana var. granulata TaxID=110450 RepID=A0A6G1DMS6_9ORYZ|nr:hypothetical protein E2562_024623 [Oryza meyeriana var. granulata]